MSAPRPRPRWDGSVTVVLLVLLAAAALLAVVQATFAAFAADACATVTCDYPRISAGLAVATIGQGAVVLVSLAAVVVRRVQGRITFAVPLLGLVAVAVLLLGGLALFTSAIPGASLL